MIMTSKSIQELSWPLDRPKLAKLSIIGWQEWYSIQNPRYMIVLGQDKEFRSFIFWHYTFKVRLLRTYYKIKRFFNFYA